MPLSSELSNYVAPSVKTFDATIASIQSTLDFINISEDLRPRLGRYLNWPVMDTAARDLAQSFMSQNAPDKLRSASGVLVVGYGAFEQFVLAYIEKCMIAIQSESEFDKLSSNVLEEHAFRTGRLLTSIKRPKDGWAIDPSDLGRRLGTCVQSCRPYELNVQAFTFEAGVLGRESLENLVARLGLRIQWDDVARQKPLMKHFNETSVRRCRELTLEEWNDLVKHRNLIAHTGGESLALSLADLRSRIGLIEHFGHALSKHIADSIIATFS